MFTKHSIKIMKKTRIVIARFLAGLHLMCSKINQVYNSQDMFHQVR